MENDPIWSDPAFSPRIAVVGSGAVGCYYGAMLARAGSDVHFLMRSDFDHVTRHGLRVESDTGAVGTGPVPCAQHPSTIGPCDLVLVAIKATANDILPSLIAPFIHDRTAILTLQNGLENDSFLASHFGAGRVLGGLCFICLNRVAPGVIRHIGHGTISMGVFKQKPGVRTTRIASLFGTAGIETEAVADLALEQWRKLVWNIPFNGLSIAANATVDEVLADSGLCKLARALMHETIAAAGALGHGIPLDFADFQLERSGSMGAYKPSSMIDWLAGKPVEVEPIWGIPLEQGTRAGVELPRMAMLVALLRKLCPPQTLQNSIKRRVSSE